MGILPYAFFTLYMFMFVDGTVEEWGKTTGRKRVTCTGLQKVRRGRERGRPVRDAFCGAGSLVQRI